MKRPNTNINVTFYLKKTSKNSDRRGIYANITFRSTQRQIATKVYANHPDHFQRGGFTQVKGSKDVVNGVVQFGEVRLHERGESILLVLGSIAKV